MKNRFNEMRYFLFVLLLILPVFSGAQTRVYVTQDQPQQIRQFRGGVDALNYFRLPVQGGHSIPAGDSLWFVKVNPGDGNIYMWDGLTWKCVSCGSGSGADSSLFVTLTRLIDSLNAMRSALADTSQAIRDDFPDVSGFVQYSDTANMLAPYVRSVVFLDSLQMHWNAIYALQSAAPYYANVLFGDGAPSGTPDNVNSAYFDRITWDTYKWNGTSWDLQMAGGLVDTTGIWKAINDTSAALRQAIDGKEDAITPGTTADYWRGDKTWQAFPFIPDSSDYWTRNDADTSLQNIRDEIANIPAPPVTSVNGQTGNVVLQFMDTAYVSGDTIYAEKGGNTFVVGVMTGDTTGIWPAIMERVLYADTVGVIATKTNISNMWANGGNSFLPSPGNDFIGTNNNNNLNIETNNVTRIQLVDNGSININQGTSGNAGIFVSASGNTSIGKNTNSGNKLEVVGNSMFESGVLTAIGSSSTVGIAMSVRNSAGDSLLVIGNNPTGSVRVRPTGSSSGTALLRVGSVGTYVHSHGFTVPNGGGMQWGVAPFGGLLINSTSSGNFPTRVWATSFLVGRSNAADTSFAVNPDSTVRMSKYGGSDTGIIGVNEKGELLRKEINSLPFVPEGTYLTYTDPSNQLIPADNSVIVVTLTGDASIILPDNPPVKSRAIVKVFGSANGLTVKPNTGGSIDGDADIVMTPKEGRFFLHIGGNDWIIINQ